MDMSFPKLPRVPTMEEVLAQQGLLSRDHIRRLKAAVYARGYFYAAEIDLDEVKTMNAGLCYAYLMAGMPGIEPIHEGLATEVAFSEARYSKPAAEAVALYFEESGVLPDNLMDRLSRLEHAPETREVVLGLIAKATTQVTQSDPSSVIRRLSRTGI